MLADATGQEAPVDPFKNDYEPKKSKFNVSGKINSENHWKNNDKISDPEPRKGWIPKLKWSEQEKNYKC